MVSSQRPDRNILSIGFEVLLITIYLFLAVFHCCLGFRTVVVSRGSSGVAGHELLSVVASLVDRGREGA